MNCSRTAAVLAAVMLVSLTGCQERNYVRIDSHYAPYAKIQMNTVNILDNSISGKIAVEQTNSRRTPTGTLEVWALLRNRTNYPLQVEGRVSFFDRDEAPIGEASAWQRLQLPPQGTATYKDFSTHTDEVANYYVEMREGR